LLPEQRAEVTWTRSATQVRFSVAHAGTELVRGQLEDAAA
jgi:hypothetical protein